MPPLRNQRHENFCHQIIEAARYGRTQGQAYARAGFKCDGHAAEANASRLLKNDNIRTRIAELTAPVVKKTRNTVDTLAAQLDAVFEGAAGDRQWSAAGSAAGLKAKLLGFMRERLEVGPAGAFNDCKTCDEVVDQMIGEEGSAQALLAKLDELRGMVASRVAADARVVEPSPVS